MTGPDLRSFRLVVLLSGSGTTMVNLERHIRAGAVPATIALVVSSRKRALGLERAAELGLPTAVLSRKMFTGASGFDVDAYARALWELVAPYRPDLAVMAGFMTQLGAPFLEKVPTVNVHPALLPAFGGPGFYGHHVHAAVLDAGVKITGATVHFADPHYDRGPIICQKAVPVLDDDTPDTLAARVQEAEREIYPWAIAQIARGKVRVEGRRTRIAGAQGAR